MPEPSSPERRAREQARDDAAAAPADAAALDADALGLSLGTPAAAAGAAASTGDTTDAQPGATADAPTSAADFFAPDAQSRRAGPDRRKRPTPIFSKYWLRGRRRGVRRGTDKQEVYVDRYSRAEWTYVIGIVVMSLADLFLTLLYISRGGEEANPFMRWALEWGGNAGFATIKMALTVAGALFLLLHARFRRVRFFMMVLFAGYVALMLYHTLLLVKTS